MPLSISPIIPAGHLSKNAQPILHADELILRPWLPDDAPAALRAFTDPAIQRWHRQTMTSQEEALAWIGQWPNRWHAEKDACWAVTCAADVVGRVSLCAINLFEGAAQITYWSLPTARGQGVAARAGAQVVQWAFKAGFHRLELKHSVANPASCRVADKLGFPLEGTLISGLRHEDGWHDMHLHARVADDESAPTDPGK
ncbi:GNAT family N-acetyltransferase [Streptosporangium sp. NBC_01756]|uniref:GNAT family N-acetyltransferase n=1 Tax=Streptosporangium sp. NBC_01756 TaxID=2975950 RepID=UPI002DD9D303|nr:GNAT family N-acetyltransferase [Streptosporangium sp. NBC_01756]WSC84608.1 GNAT family N-acetyltransferase [Streptosporangium sp. NBC_01756]